MNAFSGPHAALTIAALCRTRRLAPLAIVFGAIAAQAQPAATPAQVEQQASSRPRDLDPLMEMVIEAVKENEARYHNLETTTTITAEFDAKERVYTKQVETAHVVRQDDLIYYRGSTEFLRGDDPPRRFERLSAYDGERTRSVEVGNSANIHLARYEASQVYPPHTWAMNPLWVNFPLSVYLQGTQAVAAHPKVRRIPRPAGAVYEMTKVECEYLDEESLGDLRCHKIRCQRWSRLTSSPMTHILWLAPERNYLCVKVESMYAESLRDRSLVEEFREITPGLWLPARIRFTNYAPRALRGNRPLADITEVLTLDQAALNPAKPTSFFRDVNIPDDIPVFTISSEGTMVDSPMHPVPAEQSRSTTLEEIIAKVRISEAQFDNYDLTLAETYRHDEENNPLLESNSVWHVLRQTTDRSVLTQGKFFRDERSAVNDERLETSSRHLTLAFDGTWRRQLSNDRLNDRPQSSASLQKGAGGRLTFYRPHLTALLPTATEGRSLADFLANLPVEPRAGGQLQVEYMGDEVMSGLVCHKIRVNRILDQSVGPDVSTVLWLARDRNYLPIRREIYNYNRSAKLPAGIAVVDQLREARPGVWFPVRACRLNLRTAEGTGSSENRIIVRIREDLQLKELNIDPTPEPTLFSEINVPQGTDIAILDERGGVIGRRAQPQDGNMTITEEEYQELLKNRPARRR
jgi:hypothetical protein